MNEQVLVLKALGDDTRLNIIDMLSCGELCVCDIMDNLELTQPTVSHHLKVLHNAGLVSFRKEGKWRRFKLVDEEFSSLIEFIQVVSAPKDDCRCYAPSNSCGKK